MSVRVNLTPYFHDIVDKHDSLQANGNTVREVIEDIDRRYPGFKKEVYSAEGKVHDFIGIYINQLQAFPDELNHPVKDHDEVSILTMIEGG